ncbi:MAG: 1,4-dihydroxy-2-naphthoate polyprenyltransferase [Bacteroidota bacterium]
MPTLAPIVWLMAARPKTLWAAVAPVVIGIAMAIADGVEHALAASLALLGAVLIQVGTNFYNGYADFKKGGDTEARLGPTRVTQAGLVSPNAVLGATVVAFGLAVVAGGYLMWRGGWPIVAVGALSILFGVLYTAGRYSLAYLGISDVFVLIFFGPVAVGGTYYVQALALPADVIVAGLAPGLLSMAILLVNNIRDVQTDRKAGKRTLIVRIGRRAGVVLYIATVLSAFIVPPVLLLLDRGHAGVLITLLALPLALVNIMTLIRTKPSEAVKLNPLLGRTAQLLLLFSILFAIGWNL